MSNTHGIPDVLREVQTICGDLLPAGVLSQTWPTVPGPPSLTLPAFATQGYVRLADTLKYVSQAAHTVTLGAANGQYWLALHADTTTPVVNWQRVAGTHYLIGSGATQPSDPAGALVFAGVLVAGLVVTTVTPTVSSQPRTRVAYGGPGGALAYDPLLTWNPATAHFGVLTSTPAYPLQVLGAAHLQSAGIGQFPDPGFSLVTGGHSYLSPNVGIGANPPTTTLDVAGALRIRTTSLLEGNVTVNPGLLGIGAAPTAGFALWVAGLPSNFVTSVGIGNITPAKTLDVNGEAFIHQTLSLGAVATLPNYALWVAGNPSNFVSAVGIGNISPVKPLDVNGEAFIRNTLSLGAIAALPNFRLWVGAGNSNFVGAVGIGNIDPLYPLHVNGQIGLPGGTAGIINSLSRAVFKRDIRPLTDAVAVLRQLQPRQWEWIDPTHEALLPGTQAGFVVEEVQAVRPAWTPTDATGTPGLALRGFEAYVVAVLQDLLTRMEAVEARG
jgi:Chaperone of endosialidase